MTAILLLPAFAGLAILLHGVYIDHVRRQRHRRSSARYRAYAAHRRIREEALGVIGGSYRDNSARSR